MEKYKKIGYCFIDNENPILMQKYGEYLSDMCALFNLKINVHDAEYSVEGYKNKRNYRLIG
jgi:hypothetical protein